MNTTSTIQDGGFAFQSTIAAGGLSGGITSTMAGGDFWDGVCNGLISAGLNHAMHSVIIAGKIMVGKWIYEFHEEIHVPKQLGKMWCKYAFMEFAARQCGETELTQLDFYIMGEKIIKAYNMAHDVEMNLSQLFEACGFSVSVPEVDEDITPKYGDIIGVEYNTDFQTRHIGQMTGYGKEYGTGALVIRLSDPYYGDNHIIYESNVNSYYFIKGFQNPSANYLINQTLHPYHYYK